MNEGETIKEAALRETKEEIGVELKNLAKVAELSFYFPHNPSWDQLTHVYCAEGWENEPIETEEMRPQWFSVLDLPFEHMWSDDPFWLPHIVKGKFLKAVFRFGPNDVIIEKKVEVMTNSIIFED